MSDQINADLGGAPPSPGERYDPWALPPADSVWSARARKSGQVFKRKNGIPLGENEDPVEGVCFGCEKVVGAGGFYFHDEESGYDHCEECVPEPERYDSLVKRFVKEDEVASGEVGTQDEDESMAVECYVCGKITLDVHFHCSVCKDGDFDVCWECVDGGEWCFREDHGLVKRLIRGRQVVEGGGMEEKKGGEGKVSMLAFRPRVQRNDAEDTAEKVEMVFRGSKKTTK